MKYAAGNAEGGVRNQNVTLLIYTSTRSTGG